MKGFILSFRSEFYKTRKTMAFWSSVILPLVLCMLVFVGFYNNSSRLIGQPGMMLWLGFAAVILAVMGSLILPILMIFIAYSVNSLEHKADTWKTLFSLPVSKLSVYAAKYFYAFFLVFLCLLLFVMFTLGFGDLLGAMKPNLKFSEYNATGILAQVYFKLFLSSLGILSIQFLLSLLFRDFLKPMGIGFVLTIVAAILVANSWKYAYVLPYSHPLLAIKTLEDGVKMGKTAHGNMPNITVDIFSRETLLSLAVAVGVFIIGYFIVLKKSVK